jgi:hypothetical protein
MDQNLEIFPINSKPLGISYEQWSIMWWQWITAIPIDRNPAFDKNGQFVNVDQKVDNVIFLCQTIEGTSHIPTRINTIHSAKYFFIPIINWISIMGHDGRNDDELLEKAIKSMNVINNIKLIINNIDNSKGLMKHRVRSNYFEIDLPENNIFELDAGKKRCISDGYWAFFRCNSSILNLVTDSSCSSGRTRISIAYNLKLN